MAVIRDYDMSRRFKGKVRSSTRITPAEQAEEVRHIVLEVNLWGHDFEEYETVGVLLRGAKELGRPLILRLYSIAGCTQGEGETNPVIELCVKRCCYIDEFNGERYPGTVSNFLCDLTPGDEVELTGPFGSAFPVPGDRNADLVMISQGTGIAPFRSLIHRIYRDVGEWQGRVRLFYGARTGLELLYMNDENRDLGVYYEKKTFKAFEALSPRPHFDEPEALDRALADNAAEVWDMLQAPSTQVYVGGLEKMNAQLDAALCKIAGSEEAWNRQKSQLIESGRWNELLY